MLTQHEAIERIKDGQLQLPPLEIRLLANEWKTESGGQIDAVLAVEWQEQKSLFGVEYKARSTPKEFQSAISQITRYTHTTQMLPMILMPFLSEKQLVELSERRISGIDFCGNGVVTVPGRLFVFRTGQPNRFPASASIQNIYRKDTALVARSFLAKPAFESVNSILSFIQMSSGNSTAISLSTISKALKGLEEDLIIERAHNKIHLLQPEKLLDQLVANYHRPAIRRFLVGKSPYETTALMQRLLENSVRYHVSLVGTGVGSVAQYAVMAREASLSIYCTDHYKLLTGIEFKETARFPNLEIIETEDKTVYFDMQTHHGFPWASPVQTYLELMAGEQRERDTAIHVRENILMRLKERTT